MSLAVAARPMLAGAMKGAPFVLGQRSRWAAGLLVAGT